MSKAMAYGFISLGFDSMYDVCAAAYQKCRILDKMINLIPDVDEVMQ